MDVDDDGGGDGVEVVVGVVDSMTLMSGLLFIKFFIKLYKLKHFLINKLNLKINYKVF
jgi:hypothetical protein